MSLKTGYIKFQQETIFNYCFCYSSVQFQKGHLLDSANSINKLSCDTVKDFWIQWNSTTLFVGEGTIVGRVIFLAYESESIYDINSIAISTGWGAHGDWAIPMDQGIIGNMYYTRRVLSVYECFDILKT